MEGKIIGNKEIILLRGQSVEWTSYIEFEVAKNCNGNNIWEEDSEKAGRGPQHDNVVGIV